MTVFKYKNGKLVQVAGNSAGNSGVGSSSENKGTSLPVGTIFPSAIPLTDASVHLLDGSTISQTGVYQEFAELLKSLVSAGYNISCSQSDFDSAVSSTGNCGKFVIDSTSNTIRLPKITRFIQGLSNMIDIGKSVEAGLPNITGSLNVNPDANNAGMDAEATASGAITNIKATATGSNVGGSNWGVWGGFSFDASKSNSIYGKSTTVQPQATSFPYYIVLTVGYVSSAKLDVDNIMNEVNAKLPLAGGTMTDGSRLDLYSTQFRNTDKSATSNYKYRMYQWDDNLQITRRNSDGSYIDTAVEITPESIALYGSKTRPKYNGSDLALFKDFNVKHGYKTFNSSYCTGTCNWFRVGQAVFVVFQDVVFTANPPDQSVNILTSALPKNIVNTLFFLTPHTTTKGNARLAITTNGYVVDWWANLSLNENYAGFIGYVAQDGE